MHKQTLAICGFVLSTALCGCVVGPKYRQPDLPTPPSLAPAGARAEQTPLSRISEEPADLQTWWSRFGDPELNSLMDRALRSNLDRQTAALRIHEAREEVRVARAALLPTLNGTAGYNHTRISQNSGLSSISKLLNGAASGGGGASGGGESGGLGQEVATAGFPAFEFDTYSAGLNAAWTPDVFGAARSSTRAAKALEAAAVWSARDTDVAVTSELAEAYFSLRADQAQLQVLQANDRSQGQLLQIMAVRFRGGLATDIDYASQRAEQAQTEAQMAPLEADAAARVHQIALILGSLPDVVEGELRAPADSATILPAPPADVPIGLPSDLLRRRPDLRVAERELAASMDDVDQATAALYPQFRFTGSFDFLSSAIKNLADAASRNYVYGASLMQPLFDAGRLRAQKHVSEDQAKEAALAYRKTALTALQQVADALTRYAADQRQLVKLRSGLADAERAEALDRVQYLGGLADLTTALRAQTTALQLRQQDVQAQARLDSDLVVLYRALGGGWSDAHPAPATPPLPAASMSKRPAPPIAGDQAR